ncbi:VOC family protein [Pseudanabaena sp. FACHB-2040]|uniref:bleomycin resistance protein n=1 Tax=Pseudanabaena sp. FACHB-2040 TaxID=2692859 RepID=UPI001682A6D4|nr:VOC family protein [Pseudanabaena sp. FACHB-2040]MBD2256060.1 VOC family protein [Pseudanabaena sp. FACHB-2040]
MSNPMFNSAVPVLASLDITKTIHFYCSVLGFTKIHEEPMVYGIIQRDAVQIHFWACTEKHIAENTACRINVHGISALYAECQSKGIVHPNASLQDKPWGTREFGATDEDGNLITFFEEIQ